MTRGTSTAIAVLLGVLLVVLAVPASAQNALDVRLNHADLDPDGETRLTVSVTGDTVGDDPIDPSAFGVLENGEAVEPSLVEPLGDAIEAPDSTVMILFDISGSTRGEAIVAARRAAIELVEEIVPAGVEVGLIPFGEGASIELLPTDDVGAITSAIGALEARGATALFDAIVLGADVLDSRDGDRSLVLFTDGGDNGSVASLQDALDAATDADAPIINVALLTDDQDPDVLEALAVGSDGQLLEVEDNDGLSAAFAQVAQGFTSQYLITYAGESLADELDIAVTVAVDDQEATDGFLVINTRDQRAQADRVAGEPPPAALYDSGVFGSDDALRIALGIAFVGLLIALLALLVPRADRAAIRTLRQGLSATKRVARERRADNRLAASSIGRQALALISSFPKPAGYEDALQLRIDRAGWQLRATEFIALRVGAALAGGVVVGVLAGSVIAAVVGAVSGALVPALVLASARQRRQARFMDQLPDTLQLLSGTLKAGYGPLQGIDTIVKEMDAPMSSEFQRVLTESRLGLPLEDSLDGMSQRVDSEDFQWVVVAMNIQRQVGGNLAELLDTVSDTLRDRQQVRRQIQVLAAEGKLSGVVLVALPFVLLGWMLLTSPAFIAPLVTTTMGQIMSLGAATLMAAGILWMRKLIQIDV